MPRRNYEHGARVALGKRHGTICEPPGWDKKWQEYDKQDQALVRAVRWDDNPNHIVSVQVASVSRIVEQAQEEEEDNNIHAPD